MQAHDGSRPVKKRKTKATSDFAAQHHPEKPSARFEASASRASLSIALPGSILLNAQNEELKAVLAAQIARSAAIFGVSEIVVFKEDPPLAAVSHGNKGKYRKVEEDLDENAYLAKILEYLETPQ
jgi:predicted SPOUT superfamily RNA methylase MTH1